MSYCTSNIQFLVGALYITDEKLKEFEKKHDFPVGDEMRFKAMEDGRKQILRIPSGECTLNHLLPEFLAITTGTADLLVVWEGGDHIHGFSVIYGEVRDMDVEFKLVPKKERD